MALHGFLAKITSFDYFQKTNLLLLAIATGEVYRFHLERNKLVDIFTMKDTFVQSMVKVNIDEVLLGCQNGRIYMVNRYSTVLPPGIFKTGDQNRDLVGTSKVTQVLWYSDRTINCINVKVSRLRKDCHNDAYCSCVTMLVSSNVHD